MDRFYLSEELGCMITKIETLVWGQSDHSPVRVTLSTLKSSVGPGYWKLNASILTPSVLEDIRQLHRDAAREDPFTRRMLIGGTGSSRWC